MVGGGDQHDDADEDRDPDRHEDLERDTGVVQRGRQTHAVGVDQDTHQHDGDRDPNLRAGRRLEPEESAEVARHNVSDAGEPADEADQGGVAREPAQAGADQPAGPLVGVARERDLGGEVTGDHRPHEEDEGRDREGPHERRSGERQAQTEAGVHGRGCANNGEPEAERRQLSHGWSSSWVYPKLPSAASSSCVLMGSPGVWW